MPGRFSTRIIGIVGAALLIVALLPTSVLAASSPVITSSGSTTFIVGVPGSFAVTTTGSPTPSISESGTLPTGVTFTDNGDGTATLAGPPASGTGGTYPIAITAGNGTLPNAVQSFTLTVNAAVAPSITSAAGTTFTVGAPGGFTVTTAGTPTPTSISESGSLPSGVTFVDNGNGTATLAGTPAAATSGSYPISITASNGTLPNAAQSFTLTVSPAVAPAFTSAAGKTFTVGSPGTFTVTTSGTPVIALSESGALPTGVAFLDNHDGTATLAGTPAAGTSGSYPIAITASNGTLPNAVQSFTITVNTGVAPTITSAAGTTFAVGVAGTFTVTTTGTPVPSMSESGALPSGVTFTNNGNGTATLAGTPAPGTSGSYPITIAASNGTVPNAVQVFTLTVSSDGSYLFFAIQPGGGAAGATWSVQPAVAVVNALNQVVTTDNSTVVYLAISTNPAGGTLSCTSGTAVTVVDGIATFEGCWIDLGSSSYYSLTASSSPAATPTTSTAFYVGGSAEESLVFVTQPGGGAAGATWSAQPAVAVVDALNQVVTTDDSTVVSLAISTNPAGGTLSCTSGTSVTVVHGIATFHGCSIDVASSGYYTLGATSSPSWTSTTSGALYVTATGSRSTLAISVASARGRKPTTGYTTTTPKVTKVGTYVTWKFTGGSALAGQRVNVMVARRVSGTWGVPVYLKSVWADANGNVTFAWTSRTAAAVNVRVQWPGGSTYGVSTSRALGAYWR